MESSSEAELKLISNERPAFWHVLRVWLALGFQSFGGGSSTLFLIRRAVVQQRAWVDEDEFTRYWSLVQLAPGINLIAMTILLGNRISGAPGVAACLFGLLVPSTLITVLLTAGFSSIQTWPPIQAGLRGIVPAAAGLSLALALDLSRPLIQRSRREGVPSIIASFVLILGPALLLSFLKVSVIVLLGLAALAGALLLARYERHPAESKA